MDLRRELGHINRKGYSWYQTNLGEVVVWWEYDALGSDFDHVYDEPSAVAKRAWKPPIVVPALWVNRDENPARNAPQGRLVTHSLRMAVPVRFLHDVGMSEPLDSRRHLNDILLYQGSYWRVNVYNVRGRMRSSVIVGIEATQVNVDSDMPFDELPSIEGLTSTVRQHGFPSDGFEDQHFPHHEDPANNDL